MSASDRCRVYAGQGGPYTVVPRGAATQDERQRAMAPARAVTCLQDLWRGTRHDESRAPLLRLLAMLGDLGSRSTTLRTTEAARTVQKALAAGRLLVLEEKREFPVYVGIPDPPPPEVRKPTKVKDESDAWLEIVVVFDDETPCTRKLKIEFPNGQRIDAKPDREGKLRFEGLVPGPGKVTVIRKD